MHEPSGALSPAKRQLLARLLKKDGLSAGDPDAITRRSDASPCRLSYAQQRLWLVDQIEPGDPSYNMPVAVRLMGKLDVAALTRSLNEIVARHAVLRTTFASEAGEPVQVIHSDLKLELAQADLQSVPEAAREAEMLSAAAREISRPFDLARGPLLRVTLFGMGDNYHALLLVMHHIVTDGWSMGVLVRETMALYAAFSQGRPSPLAPLPIQYADYAVWQRQRLQGEFLERQLDYWKRQLAAPLPELELPLDRPRRGKRRGGARQWFVLPADLSEALKEFSRTHEVTLFMTLLAVFQVLLYGYTRQEDMAIGTDIANRQRVEVEGLIGFFVNMLVLRTSLAGDPTFRELQARVREVALAAYAHQDAPFEKLVEELQPGRSLSSTPLFQVVFTLQNAPVPELQVSGLDLSLIDLPGSRAKFDLVINLWETRQGITGSATYATHLFDDATIERLLEHFERTARVVIADPDVRLSALDVLSDQDQAVLAMKTHIAEMEEAFSF
jgi:Condensation domain